MTQQLLSIRAAEPPPPVLVARRGETSVARSPAELPAPTEPVLPNPQLRLDAALGLVVLEFRDRGGQARTIPTERELDAYRSNGGSAPNEEAPAAAKPTPQAVRNTAETAAPVRIVSPEAS